VEKLSDLIKRLGLSESLTSLGLSESDIPWLTQNALKVSANGLGNHPVVFDEKAIAEIYRQSL
jgi:alcohol dehydrogenase class IV